MDELESSGLSIAAFARQRALSYERLRKWRIRLRRDAEAKRPRIVELVARPPKTVAALTVLCPSGHQVELGDVELSSGLRLVLSAIAEIGPC